MRCQEQRYIINSGIYYPHYLIVCKLNMQHNYYYPFVLQNIAQGRKEAEPTSKACSTQQTVLKHYVTTA